VRGPTPTRTLRQPRAILPAEHLEVNDLRAIKNGQTHIVSGRLVQGVHVVMSRLAQVTLPGDRLADLKQQQSWTKILAVPLQQPHSDELLD
jgi:hypothetical protein